MTTGTAAALRVETLDVKAVPRSPYRAVADHDGGGVVRQSHLAHADAAEAARHVQALEGHAGAGALDVDLIVRHAAGLETEAAQGDPRHVGDLDDDHAADVARRAQARRDLADGLEDDAAVPLGLVEGQELVVV